MFACYRYGLLMPTVWEYLEKDMHTESKIWLGITISAFSISRTLCFAVVGMWADRRGFREPYTVCCAIGVIGGVCYGVAGKVLGGSLCLVVTGRFVSGIGAARATLASAYVARTVAPSGRTTWLGIVTGMQLFGNLFGPALNAIFLDLRVSVWVFELNTATSAGEAMSTVAPVSNE